MTDSAPLMERLRQPFGPNPRGAIGVADELLTVCRGRHLQLEWRGGMCRVHAPAADGQESLDVLVPKVGLSRGPGPARGPL